ncbi:hypothetical protein [Streptomyces sp. NBC_01264]|uniref:hypothetical protein n=1 Tax=Streptomyces sp. NBC_01264 TaxID=2903804 RepID=UPI0022586541|nr:hypothetical protein [Streptomyces sp. NBC_01264]MCX4782126.1 hypothetical protein [Streptomyces sp. NBC_01264]
MSVMGLWRRARRGDSPSAVAVGAVNLPLSCALVSMGIGGPFFEATTRAQETSAQELALRVFGCWLAGGLVLFLALGMTRTRWSTCSPCSFRPPC